MRLQSEKAVQIACRRRNCVHRQPKSNNHCAGETNVFGEHGTADCSKAALSTYNSDSGKTQEIGFEDLRVGDYVVIGLYENEKARAQTETVHAESVERMRQKSAQD